MNNEVLDKVKNIEMIILDEIVRICNNHHIKYFLMYGTLLGAIRHDGFIPWDDDIDIGMMRDDYEKFIKVASKELKKDFILDCNKTNNNYYLCFLKIRYKDSIYEEERQQNYIGNKGIWVDIFPHDYIINNNFKIKLKTKTLISFCKVLSYKNLKMWKNSNKLKLFYFINLIPNKLCFKYINGIGKGKTGNYITCYSELSEHSNYLYNKEDIFPLKKHIFNGKEYDIPNNSEYILRTYFGDDFMKLPPKNQRVNHKPRSVVIKGEKLL